MTRANCLLQFILQACLFALVSMTSTEAESSILSYFSSPSLDARLPMTRGAAESRRLSRRLSWVTPVDDDGTDAAATDDTTTTATAPQTRGVSLEATQSMSSATSNPSASETSTQNPTEESTSSSPSNKTAATKASGNSSKTGTTNSDHFNVTKTNTTVTTTATPTSTSTSTSTSMPINPAADDVTSWADDDYYQNKTEIIPPEKEQPASWPIDVFAVFMGAAILLFAATAFKNYQRRRNYTHVQSS